MTKHQIIIYFYKVNISKSLVYLPLHFLKIKLLRIIYLILYLCCSLKILIALKLVQKMFLKHRQICLRTQK